MLQKNSTILSVKDLNQMVKDMLSDGIGQIWLVGEISNFSRPASGHWYFSLKDDMAQVRCAMFRNSNFRTGFTPQNGQQVLVKASVTLYEARGEYQIIVEQLQLAGAGMLQQRFEQLKKQLQEQGLFDNQFKQPLPKNIQTVGVVTSSTGAALHDICQILKRRDPSIRVIIYPTLVQGEGAAPQIAKMIDLANIRQECDVLIVGRGGGSLEDLWPFNEEIVARAIFASRLPIISAVGHEIDFTIADFTADLRAATPSAAAELVSRNRLDQLNELKHLDQRLAMAIDYLLSQKQAQLQKIRHALQTQHPQVKLAKQQNKLSTLSHSLNAAMELTMFSCINRLSKQERYLYQFSPQNKIGHYQQIILQKQQLMAAQIKQYLANAKHQIAIQASQLNTVSPLATLERGYSITTNEQQQVITSLNHLAVGDTLTTKVATGKITSSIINIEADKHD